MAMRRAVFCARVMRFVFELFVSDSVLWESAFLREEACDSELCVPVEVHMCCPPFLTLGKDVSAEFKACDFPWMFLSLMFSAWMYYLNTLLLRKLRDASIYFLFSKPWDHRRTESLECLICLAGRCLFFLKQHPTAKS